MESERDAMVAAVLADLEDPHVKSVFADWLEEHGEESLARAYRWMAENGKWPQIICPKADRRASRWDWNTNGWDLWLTANELPQEWLQIMAKDCLDVSRDEEHLVRFIRFPKGWDAAVQALADVLESLPLVATKED